MCIFISESRKFSEYSGGFGFDFRCGDRVAWLSVARSSFIQILGLLLFFPTSFSVYFLQSSLYSTPCTYEFDRVFKLTKKDLRILPNVRCINYDAATTTTTTITDDFAIEIFKLCLIKLTELCLFVQEALSTDIGFLRSTAFVRVFCLALYSYYVTDIYISVTLLSPTFHF
jgi:hypothetical protein